MQILERFSTHLREVLVRSIRLATELKHAEVEPVHLLFCLAAEKGAVATEIMSRFGLTSKTMEEALVLLPTLVKARVATASPSPVISFSPSAKIVLEKSFLIAEEHSHSYVGTEHLLGALVQVRDERIARILERANIKVPEVLKQLDTVLANASQFPNIAEAAETVDTMQEQMGEHEHEHGNHGEAVASPPKGKSKKDTALDFFAVNLTNVDSQKTIDPVIGRDQEIERLIQILCRRTKNNPILLGDPGVGKTAIAEGLAKKIMEGDVPDLLLDKKIYALDMGLLIAGTMYRGEFEARLRQVIEEVQTNPNIILFIDEIHNIVGAGSNQGTMDAANILKPALSRGRVRCIGATTPGEFKKYIESDPALERRFQPIFVKEPTVADTLSILKGLKSNYEAYHRVAISDDAIVKAVELSERYITSKFLPDKAIDLIDETSAAKRLTIKGTWSANKVWRLRQKLEKTVAAKEKAASSDLFADAVRYKDEEDRLRAELAVYEKETGKKDLKMLATITGDDIARQVARITGANPAELMLNEYEYLANLGDKLKQRVIGQDSVIDRVAALIRQAKLGLSNPNRPLASFLFVGESGVGKTELAKALADTLYPNRESLIKLDMSEFNEGFGVSKLLGSPAGYVGYKESNPFTDRLKLNPHAIILFDEFDKAHHDVRKLLLQMLENGEITDATGRKVSLRQAVIIMTTSFGAEDARRGTIGFGGAGTESQALEKHVNERLKEYFTPELINRMDAICLFRPLATPELLKIAELEIADLNRRLDAYHTKVIADEIALAWLVAHMPMKTPGARDIRREIRAQIERLMVDVVASSKVKASYKLGVKGEVLSVK